MTEEKRSELLRRIQSIDEGGYADDAAVLTYLIDIVNELIKEAPVS